MRSNHLLAWAQMLTLSITAITSVPLFIAYLKGIDAMSPIFVQLHVWFGLAFIMVAFVKIYERRKLILSQLGIKIHKKRF